MKRLKQTIHRLAVLVLVSLLPGCNELLNPQPVGQQTLDVTFSDFSGVLSAVNGIYSRLSSSNLYRGSNALLLVDQASDDVIYGPRATPNYSKIDYFENAATDGFVSNIWGDLYTIIYRCNVVVDRTPTVNFSAFQGINSAGLPFKDQFIGEAKFLRAFAYFNLVRLFGDVPVHTKELNGIDQINIPRSPVADVYKQIEADLQDAAAKLPPSNSGAANGNEKGRVTRWAALGMLADVFLTQKKYAEAKQAATQTITGALANGLRLNTNYTDNFVARGGQENSPESLFEIQFGGATASSAGSLGNNFTTLMSGGGNIPRGLSAYKPSDNKFLENEPGYTGSLVQAYDPNDLRFKNTYYEDTGFGTTIAWHSNKHYVLGTNTGNENFPVCRLAEIYLIYAEATNELSGPDETSYGYVNALRRRAFGLPLTSPSAQYDVSAGQTQATFREIIRLERRRELAFENKRWFDIIRYGFDYASDVLVNKQKRVLFKREFMLFPIPATELVANPLLTQNPGY